MRTGPPSRSATTAEAAPLRRRRPRARVAAQPVANALAQALGPRRGRQAVDRLDEAADAFAAERFRDARRLLEPLVKAAPDVPEVRELLGLTFYRLRQWPAAIRELEAFRDLTGSCEQHPVLADCYRATARWNEVDELWAELRAASPGAELVTEGRIVAAGALADRGDLQAAIAELERGWKPPRRPRDHHLRRAYALADLYETAGSLPRARELFRWVAGHEPDFADVAERLVTLG